MYYVLLCLFLFDQTMVFIVESLLKDDRLGVFVVEKVSLHYLPPRSGGGVQFFPFLGTKTDIFRSKGLVHFRTPSLRNPVTLIIGSVSEVSLQRTRVRAETVSVDPQGPTRRVGEQVGVKVYTFTSRSSMECPVNNFYSITRILGLLSRDTYYSQVSAV